MMSTGTCGPKLYTLNNIFKKRISNMRFSFIYILVQISFYGGLLQRGFEPEFFFLFFVVNQPFIYWPIGLFNYLNIYLFMKVTLALNKLIKLFLISVPNILIFYVRQLHRYVLKGQKLSKYPTSTKQNTKISPDF